MSAKRRKGMPIKKAFPFEDETMTQQDTSSVSHTPESVHPQPEMNFEESRPTPDGQKKKRRNPDVVLTDDEEERIVEWLKEPETEFLYNKKKKDYKRTEQRDAKWREIAAELCHPVEDLLRWYMSMRSTFGRLSRALAGNTTKVLTDRERWIVDSFSFLEGHIARISHKKLVSFKRKASLFQEESEEEDEEESIGDNDIQDSRAPIEDFSHGAMSPVSMNDEFPNSAALNRGGRKKQKGPTSYSKEEDIMDRMYQNPTQSVKVSADFQNMVTQAQPQAGVQSTDYRCGWPAFLYHSVQRIHERVWPKFLKSAMDNYMWALSESDAIRADEERQKQREADLMQHQLIQQQTIKQEPSQQPKYFQLGPLSQVWVTNSVDQQQQPVPQHHPHPK